MVAYDSLRPDTKTTETVRINVLRNPNGPQWERSEYFNSVSENVNVGSTIFNVTATDRDVDVSYNTFLHSYSTLYIV